MSLSLKDWNGKAFQLLNLNQNSTAWNQRDINVNDVSLQTQFLSSLITLNEQASFETERYIQIDYLCLSRRFITRFSLLVNSYRRRWSLFLQKGLENWMKSVELKNKSCQFSINLLIYIFSTNLMKNSFTYPKICFKIKEIKSRYNIFTII